MEALIRRDELVALLEGRDDVRVVMALGPHRYRAAHIPGSETFATVDEALAALAPDEQIVVYCASEESPASRWACHLLTSRGYRSVRRYAGGLVEWSEAGLPLVTGLEHEEVAA